MYYIIYLESKLIIYINLIKTLTYKISEFVFFYFYTNIHFIYFILSLYLNKNYLINNTCLFIY